MTAITSTSAPCSAHFFWLGLKDWLQESRKEARLPQGVPIVRTAKNKLVIMLLSLIALMACAKWLVHPLVGLLNLLGTSGLASLCTLLSVAGLGAVLILLPLRLARATRQFCKQMCDRGRAIALQTPLVYKQ
ncbi:MAG: hypothetical protein Q7S87_09100 [Agitococcus sp.]|nr:hypothetical protein [Agitococcus sp.]MDO9177058.1 hypothetical protein [Agitococcus sp.]